MTAPNLTPEHLQSLLDGATDGPWTAANMVHADRGDQMTAEELGEYVTRSVSKGTPDRFLFVMGQHEDGGTADICLTGNGPKGPHNTGLIALAPDLARRVIELEAESSRLRAELAEAREVEPLKWGLRNEEDAHPDELVAGDYAIWVEGHECELLFWSIPIGQFGSVSEAQEFAKSHHTTRIIAALKGGAQ